MAASGTHVAVVFAADAVLDPGAGNSEEQVSGNNRPALRRGLILEMLATADGGGAVSRHVVAAPAPALDPLAAREVHSARYLEFLATAHARLQQLGDKANPGIITEGGHAVPDHIAPRCRLSRPGSSLAGQLSFYAQDRYSPIGVSTAAVLRWDLAVAAESARLVAEDGLQHVYCLNTLPGHHASRESYGGYCYVNLAAFVALRLSETFGKVALVDVDYHAGNGTASILYVRCLRVRAPMSHPAA